MKIRVWVNGWLAAFEGSSSIAVSMSQVWVTISSELSLASRAKVLSVQQPHFGMPHMHLEQSQNG